MNQPSIIGNIAARLLIPGIFSGLEGEPFLAPFVLGHYKIGAHSPAIAGRAFGTSSHTGKNIGATVQLTQYANVSLIRIPNKIGTDKFTAPQINSGKLFNGK